MFTISLKYEVLINNKKVLYGDSKSFVDNFEKFLFINFAKQDCKDFKRIDGSNVRLCSGTTFQCDIGDSNTGIHFGTGTTYPAWTDYNIENPANLDFASLGISEQDITSGTDVIGRKIIISSTYDNNSGGDITISEMGLIAKRRGTSEYYLFARDVLNTPITVANGNSITGKYIISIQV